MRAYAALNDRFLVIDGLPTAPTLRERLVDHEIECVATHLTTPDRAIVGTSDTGAFVTTDGGERFEQVAFVPESTDDDAELPSVTAVAIAPNAPETVWYGTEPSRVYRSEDGGRTAEHVPGLVELPSASEWSFPPRPHTHHVRWIEPDPHRDGRLYVGIEAGALVVTDDGGASWHDRPPGSRRDNHQLATHPDTAGRVYAAAGDGYAESTDFGETWTHPQDGLEHRYVWSLAVDPGDPDAVLVTAASGASAAHRPPGESYLYRRRGDRWERIDDEALPSGDGTLRPVLATASEASLAYALGDRGLYRTEDFGTTWEESPLDWPAAVHDQPARGLALVPEP